jgi:hypothetical protein
MNTDNSDFQTSESIPTRCTTAKSRRDASPSLLRRYPRQRAKESMAPSSGVRRARKKTVDLEFVPEHGDGLQGGRQGRRGGPTAAARTPGQGNAQVLTGGRRWIKSRRA